jgi:CubicO group peptidase (beta-lactamase class C family)
MVDRSVVRDGDPRTHICGGIANAHQHPSGADHPDRHPHPRHSDVAYAASLSRAADRVLAAGATGVLVDVRQPNRPPHLVRRGDAPRDAHFRIGSVTKTYLATSVL